MLKYASMEVLSAELAPGTSREHLRAIAKHARRGQFCRERMFRTAHRASFDYQQRPGYLYVRSRAISSRTNDNFDQFPAEEIAKAFRTFIGKPVFVNHHNDNHRRARGVVIDAALHQDTNPDGSPDTWVEVLMEVDASRFPKLAEAILSGRICRTSMGTDVAWSECTFCGNRATTPTEYCAHVARLKGKRIRRRLANGQGHEDVLVAERCYGLRFFENSLLVEDPADPTAYVLGLEGAGVSKQAHRVVARLCPGSEQPDEDGVCPGCGLPVRTEDGKIVPHSDPHGGEGGHWLGSHTAAGQSEMSSLWSVYQQQAEQLREQGINSKNQPEVRPCSKCGMPAVFSGLYHSWPMASAAYRCPSCHHETNYRPLKPGEAVPEEGPPAPPEDPDQGSLFASLIRQAEAERMTVPAGGVGESLTISVRPKDKARIERLLPFLLYGPDYNRGVMSDLRDYSTFAGRNDDWAADRFLYLAEVKAGIEEWNYERANGQPERLPGIGTLAYGEVMAPSQVDTLRDESCPVCGEADSYNGDRCQVCGFVKPPDNFMDPDLDKAKSVDLRQEQDDDSTKDGSGDLECDNCGKRFNSEQGEADEGGVKPGGPAFVPPKTSAVQQFPAQPSTAPPKLPKPTDPMAPENKLPGDQDDAPTDTNPVAGDTCPDCGKGTLRPVGPSKDTPTDEGVPPEDTPAAKAQEQAPESEKEPPKEDDSEGGEDPAKASEGEDEKDDEKPKKKAPPWAKGKEKSSALSGPTRVPRSDEPPTQKEQSMRPALAALAEQQKVITYQQKVIEHQGRRLAALEGGFRLIAQAAGIEKHPRVAALLKVADEGNPAQPVADPPAQAPAPEMTSGEATTPTATDDVTTQGQTPLTDVAPDATTSLDDTGTVLDEPLDLNEVDVTAPVAGTEGPRPLDEVKTETEVRVGDPNNPDTMWPLDGGPFAERPTAAKAAAKQPTAPPTEGRTFAALRLARLRIQAGIEAGDDLVLATTIASGPASDESIQNEIDTLAKVMRAHANRPQRAVSRSLVPRAASAAQRTVPSMAGAPDQPVQQVAYAPGAEEFLFE